MAGPLTCADQSGPEYGRVSTATCNSVLSGPTFTILVSVTVTVSTGANTRLGTRTVTER